MCNSNSSDIAVLEEGMGESEVHPAQLKVRAFNWTPRFISILPEGGCTHSIFVICFTEIHFRWRLQYLVNFDIFTSVWSDAAL